MVVVWFAVWFAVVCGLQADPCTLKMQSQLATFIYTKFNFFSTFHAYSRTVWLDKGTVGMSFEHGVKFSYSKCKRITDYSFKFETYSAHSIEYHKHLLHQVLSIALSTLD